MLGALKLCSEKGISVPDQISVYGGGSFNISETEWQNITRVKAPTEEVGRKAITMLQERLRENGKSCQGIFLSNEFIGGMTTTKNENKMLNISFESYQALLLESNNLDRNIGK